MRHELFVNVSSALRAFANAATAGIISRATFPSTIGSRIVNNNLTKSFTACVDMSFAAPFTALAISLGPLATTALK